MSGKKLKYKVSKSYAVIEALEGIELNERTI
jgi:hypothetical protein